ncbi:MAG: protein translocase subunit SecF [Wenzhouxiangellaceae bacterium]
MEFFKKQTHIDFLKLRRLAFAFSALLLLASITSVATRGLNFGLDFTGGTLIEAGFELAVNLDAVRSSLDAAGFQDYVVQQFGDASSIAVRLAPREQEESNAEISSAVLDALQQSGQGEIDIRRVDFVGPQIGKELAEKGALAMFWVLLGILAYVSIRFQWRFSVGAVTALVHDIIITTGILSFTHIQFDLTVVAALLAVIGYSLNDTIVVFDRIRENFQGMRKTGPVEVINTAINQMLSRTIMTSGTTLLVLAALYVFGGEAISGFALTLIIGIVVGTYSSIYVASAVTLRLGVSREDLLETKVEKEGANLDSMP